MKKVNLENYNYENRVLSFKSYIKEFTTDLYEEFNYKSEQIGLLSKINDLFDEKKVNFTEDQAAWHPKYREESSKKEVEKYYKLLSSAKNVVPIGIGGSFEGPKLLIESMGSTVSNYLFITGSDPHEFEEKIKRLKRTETIFIVASKSFTTDETIEMLKKAFAWSQGKSNFIAITANRDEANKYNIDNIIEIDKEIGGRYSIWSDISLAAYFENHPHLKEEFLQGGSQADRDLKRDDNYFFICDSDALIVKGLLSLLCKIFSGQKSEEILSISHSDILNSIGLSGLITVQRTNGFASAVKKIHEMSI